MAQGELGGVDRQRGKQQTVESRQKSEILNFRFIKEITKFNIEHRAKW
jgi:hypothetical protein